LLHEKVECMSDVFACILKTHFSSFSSFQFTVVDLFNYDPGISSTKCKFRFFSPSFQSYGQRMSKGAKSCIHRRDCS